MFKNMIKLDNNEIFIPFVMILILPFIWFISITTSYMKNKNFNEVYNKCKTSAPTKVYQGDNRNFVVIEGKVYEVDIEEYGLFTVGEKCK